MQVCVNVVRNGCNPTGVLRELLTKTGNAGNYDHVMAVKRIITAVCSHFPNQKNQVEKSLLDYAVGLFQKEWLKQAKEEGGEYDREEELEEAKRVFLKIYKTEKDVDVW